MRIACARWFRVGITTSKSTSLSGVGVPQAYEPNKIIFSGRKRSAMARA